MGPRFSNRGRARCWATVPPILKRTSMGPRFSNRGRGLASGNDLVTESYLLPFERFGIVSDWTGQIRDPHDHYSFCFLGFQHPRGVSEFISDNSRLSKSNRPILARQSFSVRRCSRGSRRRGQEEAEAKVARMTQTQRTTHRRHKRDPKHARKPTTAVVARFLAAALKMQRAKTGHDEELFFLDRRNRR